MPLEIVTVPCLSDNYAFLIHDAASGETAAVDVPEAAPLAAALEARGWTPDAYPADPSPLGPRAGRRRAQGRPPGRGDRREGRRHRLPPLDLEVAEGDSFTLGNEDGAR
jgi:hydroxyacylglutathione hydrolase